MFRATWFLLLLSFLVLADSRSPPRSATSTSASDFGRALSLMQASAYIEAEAALKNVVRRNPTHADARVQLANCYAALGLPHKAERQLRRLLKIQAAGVFVGHLPFPQRDMARASSLEAVRVYPAVTTFPASGQPAGESRVCLLNDRNDDALLRPARRRRFRV